MGKSKATKSSTTAATTSKPSASTSIPTLTCTFPNLNLTSKSNSIQPQTLIDSQVILFPNLLSNKQSDQLINHFSDDRHNYHLVPSPLPKKGQALRTNSRIGFQDPTFANQKLWEGLGIKDLVKDWKSLDGKKKPKGLSGNIRIYRYLPTELFGPHYDESTRDESTGLYSEWTLLIYLTGKEDGVEGGETVFYENHSTKNKAIIAPLEKGMGLFHRHGQACMLHEGRAPSKGVKWILRSDLLFG